MMFVWWAVFFFAGTFFPSGSTGAASAMAVSFFLAVFYSGKNSLLWQRVLLTCVSGLLVFMTASLLPSGPTGPTKRRTGNFPASVRAVRDRMISITGTKSLNGETQGLLRALLIADRTAIPYEVRRHWSATGTAHYLALSGLHLGLIAVPLFAMLTLAGARGMIRDVTALFALSFYASVAGTPGSLLRALSMMTVMRMFRLGGIRINLAKCVIAGAFLVCIIDPRSLVDTGFLLSFNAAAGVALIGIPVSRHLQVRMSGNRWMKMLSIPFLSIVMSLSVQLSMLPFIVKVFGFAPLAGPVMSVLMALPVTAMLYGGFIYVIAGHALGDAAALPLNVVAGITTALVERGSKVSGAGVLISDFDSRLYIPGFSLFALGLGWNVHRRRIIAAGLILALVSFKPAVSGRESTGGCPIEFPRNKAVLYGGRGGVLVLEEWPSERTASYLAGDLRRSGVRGVGSILILAPGDCENAGISLLRRDLGVEKIFISPWSRCIPEGGGVWHVVSEPAVVGDGKAGISVRPPTVLPRRGLTVLDRDASLSITPLD
jgi:ComEC/Rec2-related protein